MNQSMHRSEFPWHFTSYTAPMVEQKSPLRGVKYVNVAGSRLEIRRLPGRNPLAPTLVFLHEGLGCVEMWQDFPDKLSELTGCAALVYSRQGYGRSDPIDVPRSTSYIHAEALETLPKFLEAEVIGDYVLIGHSDGASIALIYGGSTRRQGLRAIVSMAPHVFCEELTLRSIRQAKVAFEQDDLRSRLAKYHIDNVDNAFWGWNQAWLDPDFIHWNIEEYLPGITVPQLIIQGKDDPYGTTKQPIAIRAKSSGSVLVHYVGDCGHSPHKEQPMKALTAIHEFLHPYCCRYREKRGTESSRHSDADRRGASDNLKSARQH